MSQTSAISLWDRHTRQLISATLVDALDTNEVLQADTSWKPLIKAKETLNQDEKLETPADYALIRISEQMKDSFEPFARKICNERIGQLKLSGIQVVEDIKDVLPALTEEEEAIKLGAKEQVADFRRDLQRLLTPDELAQFDALSPLEEYLLSILSSLQVHPTYREEQTTF